MLPCLSLKENIGGGDLLILFILNTKTIRREANYEVTAFTLRGFGAM